MIGHLGELISQYGYLVVGAFIFLEGLCLPFPTDTTLVTASVFASRGRLSLAAIIVVSTIATTLGTTVAFYLGRRSSAFVDRHAGRMNPGVVTRTRHFIDRHGEVAVLFARFIPVARMLIAPLAGLSSMSLLRFSIFNFLGAVLWSVTFCAIGFFFGEHRPALGRGVVQGALIVAVALATLVSILMLGGWLVEESDAAWRAEGTIWHRILVSRPMRLLAARSPAFRAFVFQRFTPNHYLGLNLTIGLGVSFVALLVFNAVSHALFARGAVPRFDVGLLAALRETSTPDRREFWATLASAGRLPVVAAASSLLAIAASTRGRTWRPLLGLTAALVGAGLLDVCVELLLTNPYGNFTGRISMIRAPSGQSLMALVGYGMVAYFCILMVRSERTRIIIATLVLCLVGAISFGRLYIGEHYFSEIVGGLAAGAVWLSACLTGLEVARRRQMYGSVRDSQLPV